MSRRWTSTSGFYVHSSCAIVEVREENVVDADFPSGNVESGAHRDGRWCRFPNANVCCRSLRRLPGETGGTLFLEEPDSISVRTLDRTGFGRCVCACSKSVRQRGSDPDWARDLPFKMTSLGLGNVRAEGETPYFQGASELARDSGD